MAEARANILAILPGGVDRSGGGVVLLLRLRNLLRPLPLLFKCWADVGRDVGQMLGEMLGEMLGRCWARCWADGGQETAATAATVAATVAEAPMLGEMLVRDVGSRRTVRFLLPPWVARRREISSLGTVIAILQILSGSSLW